MKRSIRQYWATFELCSEIFHKTFQISNTHDTLRAEVTCSSPKDIYNLVVNDLVINFQCLNLILKIGLSSAIKFVQLWHESDNAIIGLSVECGNS